MIDLRIALGWIRVPAAFLCLCIQTASTAQTPKPQNIPATFPPPVLRIPAETKSIPKGPSVRERKKQFAEKYTNLIQRLNEFSDAYGKTGGEVMPLDKVKAVKRAWKELQAAEPAFK